MCGNIINIINVLMIMCENEIILIIICVIM